MLEKYQSDADAEVVSLTYDVRQALHVLGRAVRRNPKLFGEMVKRGVPARLLLSQILEMMLVDKKQELEVMKASLEFVKATGDEIRREREAECQSSSTTVTPTQPA